MSVILVKAGIQPNRGISPPCNYPLPNVYVILKFAGGEERLTPREVKHYCWRMKPKKTHVWNAREIEAMQLWMSVEIEEMRHSVGAMESGKMQIRYLQDNGEWIDGTATEKPNIREKMWQLEKWLKPPAASAPRP